MTLIFNRLLEVVKVHVHAKFYQATCNGLWVTVFTEKQKKLDDNAENNTAVASAAVTIQSSAVWIGLSSSCMDSTTATTTVNTASLLYCASPYMHVDRLTERQTDWETETERERERERCQCCWLVAGSTRSRLSEHTQYRLLTLCELVLVYTCIHSLGGRVQNSHDDCDVLSPFLPAKLAITTNLFGLIQCKINPAWPLHHQ